MNDNAIIIIAKYPEEGNVKTRLKGLMPDEKRLELYVSMLENTLHKLKSVPGVDTFIAYAPESKKDYFTQFGVGLIPLPEGDLGARMFYAFRELFNPKNAFGKGVPVESSLSRLFMNCPCQS